MAFSHRLPLPLNIPPPTPNNINSQAFKTSLSHVVSMHSNHKMITTQDPSFVSHSSKLQHYATEHFNLTDEFQMKHERKLEEVRHLLGNVREDRLEGLTMIDVIQRLGIDYHFQEEIEAVLQKQYMGTKTRVGGDYRNLYEVSLGFRLLRQQGYHVPADVFNNFKGKDGKFKEKLRQDIKGLMGLYEASQLSTQGEDVLDEAANFSSQLLNSWIAHLDDSQCRTIESTVKQPYHKSLVRFTAKSFLGDFGGTSGWQKDFQELAEMEYSMVDSIHQKEILHISKWWKDLGLAKELTLARDQPVKWYMWPVAMLTDPSLTEQRIDLTKTISLIYIIDDIFDLYGTLDELTLFTEAVNRWEFAAVEQLPDYMKLCFKALYNITNEISYNVYKKHGWNPTYALRNTWATLCNAFLIEAKWFASGHMPKADEYLKNGAISSGVHVVLIHLFFLLGHGTTKDAANLVNDNPGIISSVATILRLWDDLGSAKDENQDGKDGSYVEFYMKEHQGSSVQTARRHVTNIISDTWKKLNRECLSPNPYSSSFRNASLNLARMVPLMYSYDDNHRLPLLEEHIKSMLFDGVSSQSIRSVKEYSA